MQLGPLGSQAFMQRLAEAFTWAEGARKKGLIQAYGLASWDCFRKAPGSAGYLSLLSIVQLAQQVGGVDHGFRCSLSVIHEHAQTAQCSSKHLCSHPHLCLCLRLHGALTSTMSQSGIIKGLILATRHPACTKQNGYACQGSCTSHNPPPPPVTTLHYRMQPSRGRCASEGDSAYLLRHQTRT